MGDERKYMRRIASFEKVSFERYLKDWQEFDPLATEEEIRQIYDDLQLPSRATKGSAGYDFHAPCDFSLSVGAQIRIPTGIRVRIDEEYVLMLFPRSSLGFKYRLQLDNTVGIIDNDYYYAENEGHIFCKLTNDSRDGKCTWIKKGAGFVQGIFLPFGITEEDAADQNRTGGFGSTDLKG